MIYRRMKQGEEAAVGELARRVFKSHVAHTCEVQGVEKFMRESTAEAIGCRLAEEGIIVVAEDNGAIVGMIELRARGHICALFVEAELHKRGIGQGLIEYMVGEVKSSLPDVDTITVSAVVDAIEFYKKCGFVETGEKTTTDGFVYVPMKRPI